LTILFIFSPVSFVLSSIGVYICTISMSFIIEPLS
jgi:hypothetical protein